MSKRDTHPNITLNLTVDEVNLILEGIGLLPFVKVYGLVAKVQQQASQQLGDKPETEVSNAG